MKTMEKVIISGVAGTALMTFYSYLKAKEENEKYSEPEMLNELIDNSKNLPEIKNEESHPLGWLMHFGTGISFVAIYRLIYKKALQKPDLKNIITIGSLSGIAGILIWESIFSIHENPPKNDRKGYFRQLFFAHIVFSAAALLTYKNLNGCVKLKNRN